MDRPHLVPLLDVVSSLVHYAQAHDVASVMVDSEWMMQQGRVLTMDEGAWRRLRERWPGLVVPAGLEV